MYIANTVRMVAVGCTEVSVTSEVNGYRFRLLIEEQDVEGDDVIVTASDGRTSETYRISIREISEALHSLIVQAKERDSTEQEKRP